MNEVEENSPPSNLIFEKEKEPLDDLSHDNGSENNKEAEFSEFDNIPFPISGRVSTNDISFDNLVFDSTKNSKENVEFGTFSPNVSSDTNGSINESDIDFKNLNNQENEEYEDFDFDFSNDKPEDKKDNNSALNQQNFGFLGSESADQKNDEFENEDFDFDNMKSTSENTINNESFNANDTKLTSDNTTQTQQDSFFDFKEEPNQVPESKNFDSFDDFGDFTGNDDNNFEFGDFDDNDDNNFDFGDFDSTGDNNLSFEDFDNTAVNISHENYKINESGSITNDEFNAINLDLFFENVKNITSKLNKLKINDTFDNEKVIFDPTIESFAKNFVNEPFQFNKEGVLNFHEYFIGKEFMSLLDKSNVYVSHKSVNIRTLKAKAAKQKIRTESKPKKFKTDHTSVLKPQPLIPKKTSTEESNIKSQTISLDGKSKNKTSRVQNQEVVQFPSDNTSISITEETRIDVINNEIIREEKGVDAEGTNFPVQDIDLTLIDSISSGLITSFSDPSVEHSSNSLFDIFFTKEETNISQKNESQEMNQTKSSNTLSSVNLNIIPPTSYSSNLNFEVLFPSNKNETNEDDHSISQPINEVLSFKHLKDKRDSSSPIEIEENQIDTIQEPIVVSVPEEKQIETIKEPIVSSSPEEKQTETIQEPITNIESITSFSNEPIETNFDLNFNFNSDLFSSNNNSNFDASLLFSLNPVINPETSPSNSSNNNEQSNNLLEEILDMIPDISYLASFTLTNPKSSSKL